MTELETAIKTMPKVELHRHLEGCVRIPTIIRTALRHNLKLPTFDAAELSKTARLSGPMDSLTEVLKMFEIAQSVFVSYGVVEEITRQALEDAYRKENVRLLELRYSPDFMLKGKDLDWQKTLEVIASAAHSFQRKYPVFTGIIIIASRSYGMDSVLKTIDFAVKNKALIAGFDFADDEINYPAALYAEAVKKLHEAEIPLTIHSGEEGRFGQVLDAINFLAPRRIGHGVKAIEDPSGRTIELIKEKGITIETNPYSNYLTRAVARLEDHPLKKFIEAGVSVSIGADDPEILDTDLNKEYLLAVEKTGLSTADLAYANKCALAASFLPPDKKQEAAKWFAPQGS
ncbi:MAG: adenosine deaminase [Elusimicrobia bacterium RIFOXYA12_FULL_51_18]|nr:MAG: adenosine deaminase [Elusimicrobia bacterium RIFOXYA12_FULL_51_18]OGS31105.1 MAG: adenosine deaminase [Elusimicrobia bacterium RIFOXYA2_FULL_53_38]